MPKTESKFGAVNYYPLAGGDGRRAVQEERAASAPVNAEALARRLRERVRGEVRFDAGNRALYATDSSIYRQVPIGVVIPRDAEDVIETVAVCREYGAPILPRGCGTSLEGQCCNVAVVMDMSKYLHHVLEINPEQRHARVESGVIDDVLRKEAERHHLTLAPDPATHSHSTIGGMIGNGSCGPHSVMGGKTEDNIEELDILLYDGTRMRVGHTPDDELERIIHEGGRKGEIYARLKALRDKYADLIRARYPNIPRRVSGYNLNELLPENGFNVARALVGSEGTCATVLEATARLVYSPPVRPLVVLGYPDAYTMADHVMDIMEFGPIALEGFDSGLVAGMKKKQLHTENLSLLPPGGGWLLVEFGADTAEEADARARKCIEALRRRPNAPHIKLFDNPAEAKQVWEVRESAVGAVSAVPGQPLVWPAWEDASAPPEKLGDYLRDTRKLLDRYGYEAVFFGHFGQGCVHMRMDFGLKTAHEVEAFRQFMYDAAHLAVSYGGALSGEHGDGQAHAELLPIMFGPELVEAFREFKGIWDPTNKMNPGKLVDAYRMDQNLRFGIAYDPLPVQTHFQFPQDHFSFARTTERCVGVGKCRRIEQGTMCPSFMVTREEMHSTRGRARLLFEMLQGDPIKGWKNESVKEALDLCLACKGCKGECPVRVDMATYKAEFLSHYYQGRLRPPSAYAMGLIYWWARLAAHAPRLANALTHTPGLAAVAKRVGGIAPQREMPAFAEQTFKQWFSKRPPRNQDKPEVMLWADTFNNHFHPETARAAVEVLEAAGYQVVVPESGKPQQTLCCGRPLYDYGMLHLAKWHLRQILDRLEAEIQRGVPIVALEPSCCSVFRDELLNLFPNDEDANRLARQTFTLAEFLQWHAQEYQPPKLHRKAVVHGHCHHKSVLGMNPDTQLLDALGLDYQMPDTGCCGMAGSFGFEAGERYEVSQKCGERVLLPAVREASEEALIVADGFSCREQIAQGTRRHALHLAEVIQMALRAGDHPPTGLTPEAEAASLNQQGQHDGRRPGRRLAGTVLAGAGMALVGGMLIWRTRGRRAR